MVRRKISARRIQFKGVIGTISHNSYITFKLIRPEIVDKSYIFTPSPHNRPFAILLPPHLYGELAKTEQGCELLRVHADLKNLLHVVRNPRAPADERKGALWAVVSARLS